MEISRLNDISINARPINFTLPFKIGSKGQEQHVPMPAGMPIRKRVAKEFGIEVLDSDVKFVAPELLVIEHELKRYRKRKKHLIGVKQIVKNRKHRITVQTVYDVSAGGAYDSENRRIYIFDTVTIEGIPEVLAHEIGHAVNHFNVELRKFMEFVKDNGYNMVEYRKCFLHENKLHQFGIKQIDIPKEKWQDISDRFSLNSMKRNSDVFGEIVLDLCHERTHPWDENPLEKFAWLYEWYVNKNEAFLTFAEEAAKVGDSSWLRDYEFLKNEVFEGAES